MPNSNNTVHALLTRATGYIDLLDAELLLSHILQKPREFFITHPEHSVSLVQRIRFLRAVRRRTLGVPLAYITGHKEFYGLDFVVNKHTLIPRPETELMIEETVEEIRKLGNKETVFLVDVGTGSGCIPISILKTMKQPNSGTIKTFAIDISRGALRVARKNATNHNTTITFLHGNLLSPITRNSVIPQFYNSSLIITANLPYLTNEQFNEEPSIQHEPHSALVAKENGLALYRQLLEQVNSITASRRDPAVAVVIPQFYNSSLSLFLEIDPSQSSSIKTLIKQILPQSSINIKKDLRGQDRVVYISL